MVGTLQAIQVTKQPQRIQTFLVANETFLLVNNDITNQIFIGNDPSTQPVPVPALGSITLTPDKHHDIWVSTGGVSVTVQALMLPNGSNWTPSPAQVAAQINALGLAKDTTLQTTNANTNATATNVSTVNTTLGAPAQNSAVQTLGGVAGRSVAQDMLNANHGVTTEVAALLATGAAGGTPGGIPLLRFTNQLGNASNATLPGSNQVSLISTVAVNQPSYEMLFSCSIPAGVGTIPFVSITISWVDSATSFIIKSVLNVVASGNGPANAITYYLNGPTFGNKMTVTIQNLDPAQTLTYSWVINQTSHVHLVDNILQSSYPATAPITFSVPGGTPSLGVLCMAKPTINASSNVDRLLGVYSGKAFLYADNTGQANGFSVQLLDPTGSLYSNIAAQAGVLNIVAAGGTYNTEIALPRGPMLLRMRNTGASGTIAPEVIIVTKDY